MSRQNVTCSMSSVTCDTFPFRFPLHQGFSEGWGLYSETLGYEFGLYDDPMVR